MNLNQYVILIGTAFSTAPTFVASPDNSHQILETKVGQLNQAFLKSGSTRAKEIKHLIKDIQTLIDDICRWSAQEKKAQLKAALENMLIEFLDLNLNNLEIARALRCFKFIKLGCHQRLIQAYQENKRSRVDLGINTAIFGLPSLGLVSWGIKKLCSPIPQKKMGILLTTVGTIFTLSTYTAFILPMSENGRQIKIEREEKEMNHLLDYLEPFRYKTNHWALRKDNKIKILGEI